MKKCVISVGIIVLALVCFCAIAVAEAEEPPILEQVVVTASRVKEKKKELTTNVTVIDEEEIKNSSAKDLGELLAEKGVGYVRKYPGSLSSIGIRGFRTDGIGRVLESRVLILIDGRPAGTVNLSAIMTKNVEKVEIIRGPGSVQYGSRAMGGVINVITKRGKAQPKAFVEGTLGSFGYEEGSVGISGKHGLFDFSGTFTNMKMDDYDTATGTKYYNTGYDGKSNVSLNLGVEFLPGHRLGLIYRSFDADKVGSPGYLSANDLDNYAEWENGSLDIGYEGRTSGGQMSWKIRYFSGEDKYKWVDPTIQYGFKRNSDQKGAQGQISLNISNSTITAGADWENYALDCTSSPKQSEYDNPAYFLFAKTRQLNQKLILTGGIRYDDYKVKLKRGEGGTEKENNVSPRLGMAYLLTNHLKLRVNYGEAFRMPTPEQLAGNFTSSWTHYVGNPDLDPEKSKTYEGGIDFYHGPMKASGTYFHTKFKDKIQTTTTSTGDTTWENLGEATIAGFEGDLSADVGAFFGWSFEIRPYVSIVYLTDYEDEQTSEDLKYVSDKIISYGITISDGDGFAANLDLTYTGKQKIDDWESGWPAPVVTKDGFTVANLSISKKLLDFGKYGKFTLKGQVRNLFDKDYSYVKGYPMPGRSLFLGLKYEY